MKYYLVSLVLLMISLTALFANDNDHRLDEDTLMMQNTQHYSTDFFRFQFQNNNFGHVMDNHNDFSTFMLESTGDFNDPELTFISLLGNSYRWNKYSIDGQRINSQFYTGSALHDFDLFNTSLTVDANNGEVLYNRSQIDKQSVSLKFNMGGIGGINPLTQDFINIFHLTATQRALIPIEERKHTNGAVKLNSAFQTSINNETQDHQFALNFGQRILLDYTYEGISGTSPENYLKASLRGDLPKFFDNGLFDRSRYIISAKAREDLYSEINMAEQERAKQLMFAISVWGDRETNIGDIITGLNYHNSSIEHNNINFTRNIFDMDGESLNPWYADGNVHELSWSFTSKHPITEQLSFQTNLFNTLIHFNSTQESFHNTLYVEDWITDYTAMNVYQWQSSDFPSGLLDNNFRLTYQQSLSENVTFDAFVEAVVDGMLLKDKSKVNLGFQAEARLHYFWGDHFRVGLNLAKRQSTFNFDHVKFFSNDYLNGKLYAWSDINDNKQFDKGEAKELVKNSGGKYHEMADNLQPQSYVQIDIPLMASMGRHKFSVLSTYKKYYYQWHTSLKSDAANIGYTKMVDDQEIFFFNGNEANYLVDKLSKDMMTNNDDSNIFSNKPFMMQNLIKYSYEGPKWYASVAFTQHMVAGTADQGNDPAAMDLDVLSEEKANPNAQYKQIGRLHQDRAYMVRSLVAYNPTEQWSITCMFKYKDGQPISSYSTAIDDGSEGSKQVALWNHYSRGINPVNGDFGTREDFFMNFDLRTSYRGKMKTGDYEINLTCYNILDFGTELLEYSFKVQEEGHNYENSEYKHTRAAMEINIPRGMMLSAKFNF